MRALAALGAALLGAGLAVTGVVVHRLAWRGGGVLVPWGLALAVVTPLACGVAVRQLGGGRPGTLGLVLGWLLVTGWVLGGRPEGDFAVAADPLGWGFLLLAGGGLAGLAGWSLFTRTPARAGEDGRGG